MGKHYRDFPLSVDGWMDGGRVESAIITIIDSITLLAFVGFCVFFFRKKVGVSSRCWNRVFSIVNTKRQCRSTFTIDHVIARDWLPLNAWISTHIVFFFPLFPWQPYISVHCELITFFRVSTWLIFIEQRRLSFWFNHGQMDLFSVHIFSSW